MNHEEIQVYIDNCSSESHLGVILDSNLLFDDHVDKAMKKANWTLCIMKKYLH